MSVRGDPAARRGDQRARLERAIEAASREVRDLEADVARAAGTATADVLGVQRTLLLDPALLDAAWAAIRDGGRAEDAWRSAVEHHASRLASLNDTRLASRASDLRDVGDRVEHALRGSAVRLHLAPACAIAVADDLTPSEVTSLVRTGAAGAVTTRGSHHSHAAVLARALHLPMLVGVTEAVRDLPANTQLLLDADARRLVIAPDAATRDEGRRRIQEIQAERAARAAAARGPAVTRDGRVVAILANAGSLPDVERVVAMGGEGIGLLRSELLFLDRVDAPAEEEQAAAFGRAARLLGPRRPLVIRTFDAAPDKPLPFLSRLGPRPASEARGLARSLETPDLFRAQVRAVLRASAFGDVRLSFPMVTGLADFLAARRIVEEERARLQVGAVELGASLETPEATHAAAALAGEADFLSIGTNDLTSLALGEDRFGPSTSPRADTLHPRVLRLVRECVQAAHDRGRRAGVCGLAAMDTDAVAVFLGLGIDELSVEIPAMADVKERVRALDSGECRGLARDALSSPDAPTVRALVRALAS